MYSIRRRLASGALVLTVLQLTLLFAAPLSACCVPSAATHHASVRSVTEEIECCPPGTHPPGQCPRHQKARAAAAAPRGAVTQGQSVRNESGATRRAGDDSGCRVMCDAPHGAAFVVGLVGVIPPPVAHDFLLTADAVETAPRLAATVRPAVPDPPPPRLL